MENKNIVFKNTTNSVFSDCCNYNYDHMKRSPSELALEEFIASSEDHFKKIHNKSAVFGGFINDHDHGDHSDNCMMFSYKTSGPLEGVTNPIECDDYPLWPHNIYPNQSNVPLPIKSQSSVYVDSPLLVNNSKIGTGDSSQEQFSDEDDQEDIEAGPCEQSMNPADIKLMRRMKSNRDSARRSRRRKQAHLAELQQQVEQLQGESASLFKQLALATQQFKDATTNNRVLRSDVEALRAKVKLAEDLVARGSLTSSLSHLLQNYLNTAHDYIDNTNLDVTDHHNIVPPVIPSSGHVHENPQIIETTSQNLGLENPEAEPKLFDSIISNGVLDPEIWNWESLIAPPVSK